ncbi:unnamed protein product [Miscanthus lutarioriparius]|uniref:Tryptophan synthase beta chain-like PALP domain-containing protein n=1 Tax=Miscanthus lutarioriparius TaxID=422564 RepID=A0A811SAV5_9POAL|nr:unnamed protein product [Miscanthus lutarioriparius]
MAGDTEGQQEHIASDVTQVVSPSPLKFSSFSLTLVFVLAFWFWGRHERLTVRVRRFLQLIGWTPLIELKRIAGKEGVDARIVGKVEAYQPLLRQGSKRFEWQCKFSGIVWVNYSPLIVAYADPALGFPGIDAKVEELKKELPNVHVLDQFKNKANPEAHIRWTGPEIWKDTAGKVDIFVAGSGSGGTVSGVGKYLKTQNPSIKIICVEPAESPVVSGGEPGKHKIQGIGPGFLPEVLDTSVIDEVVTVTTEEAMVNARRLAREEGLLVGISSGANLAACLKVASREENKGKMIVTMFPSGGERYMNSDLFAAAREECIAMTFYFFQKRAMGYFPCNGRHVLHVADIRSYHNELRDFATEFILNEYV